MQSSTSSSSSTTSNMLAAELHHDTDHADEVALRRDRPPPQNATDRMDVFDIVNSSAISPTKSEEMEFTTWNCNKQNRPLRLRSAR